MACARSIHAQGLYLPVQDTELFTRGCHSLGQYMTGSRQPSADTSRGGVFPHLAVCSPAPAVRTSAGDDRQGMPRSTRDLQDVGVGKYRTGNRYR